MALFMLMGKYSPEAVKAILETGSDREAVAKKALEAAGGKLLGFYGMFGQDYNVAIIRLDEGVQMMSRVERIAPADVAIGMRVRAVVRVDNGNPLVVFEPLEKS